MNRPPVNERKSRGCEPAMNRGRNDEHESDEDLFSIEISTFKTAFLTSGDSILMATLRSLLQTGNLHMVKNDMMPLDRLELRANL